MSDTQKVFQEPEIFPGVLMPITYDLRNFLVAAAVRGDFALVEFTIAELKATDWHPQTGAIFTYLRELMGLPAFFDAEQVLDELFAKRAARLGLATADRALILAAEASYNRALSIGELRREKAIRDGTYVPLVNGEW